MYYKTITIAGNTGVGPDHQVLLKVGESSGSSSYDFHLEAHSTAFPSGESDGGDLDFRSSELISSRLPFHVLEISGSAPNRTANIWVKVSASLSGNQDVRCYYGHAGQINLNNCDGTFIFADAFTGSSLNTNKWTSYGSVTVTGGIVSLDRTTVDVGIYTNNAFAANAPFVIDAKYYHWGTPYRNRLSHGVVVGGSNPQGIDAGDFSSGTSNYYWNGWTGVVLTADTWYILRWINTASAYTYKVLDLSGTEKLSRNTASPYTNAKYLSFSGNESAASDMKFEYVFVRKYAVTQPTFSSAGAEQTIGYADVDSITARVEGEWPDLSYLSRWDCNWTNTNPTIGWGTAYEGEYNLTLYPGISGNNYVGKFTMFPKNIQSVNLTGGSVSWAVQNIQSGLIGPVIRCSTTSITGTGYFAALNGLYAPTYRVLNLYKGNLDGLGEDSCIATVSLGTSGISGNWYEYKVEWYGPIPENQNWIHFDIYENTGTRSLPTWALRTSYVDINGYAPGYVGMMYTSSYQKNTQRIAGTGTAGSADGNRGFDATFNMPTGMSYDNALNKFIVCDHENNSIRLVDKELPNKVTTLSISGGAITGFYNPTGICNFGGYYWITSDTAHKIWCLNANTGELIHVAGSGVTGSSDNATGTTATMFAPNAICNNGTSLFWADSGSNKIRKLVTTAPYAVSTVAGSGTASEVDDTGASATFNSPSGIIYIPTTTSFYITTKTGNKLRKMTDVYFVVTTLAGSGTGSSVDGFTTAATFNAPKGLQWIGGKDIMVWDTGGKLIRLYDMGTGYVNTVVGDGANLNLDGSAKVASIGSGAICMDARPTVSHNDRFLYTPSASGNTIWKQPIDLQAKIVCGDGTANNPGWVTTKFGRDAQVPSPMGICYYDGYLYVTNYGYHTVQRIDPATWEVKMIAGLHAVSGTTGGIGSDARFYNPYGIVGYGGYLYIADWSTGYVKRINLSNYNVENFIVTGVNLISVCTNGTNIFISSADLRIRKSAMDGSGLVTAVGTGSLGDSENATGTSATVMYTWFSQHSIKDNRVYFGNNHGTSVHYNSLRSFALAPPHGTLLHAFNRNAASAIDGQTTAATAYSIRSPFCDSMDGNIYINDSGNNKVRVMSTSGAVTSYTGLANTSMAAGSGIGFRTEVKLGANHFGVIVGDYIYIANYSYHVIMRIMKDTTLVNTKLDYIKIKKEL